MPLIERESGELQHSCHCRMAEPGQIFGGATATPHYPRNLELEPQHMDIAVWLDFTNQAAHVDVIITVRAEGRGGLLPLELDGVDFVALKIEDDQGRELTHSYDGQKIRILYADKWLAGEVRRLKLHYRVEKPRSGLHFSQGAEDPTRSVYAATDHETERARHWLACIDQPAVRTTLELKITAPQHMTILGNGQLLTETRHEDGTKTSHWHLKQRCPSYLICFAVGDFVRYDETDAQHLPIAYFASRDFTPQDLQRSFGKTPRMIAWIEKRLGLAFPYPKYYQFALPFFGGAMENISLVSWSDDLLLGPRDGADRQWLVDQTNVHELAHSYFGDLVVCRDFAHAWLKESWATYMETVWLEDEVSTDEALYDLYRNAKAYFDEADNTYKRPMVTRTFTTSWQMYDRHLYPGGAIRLHTLRRLLGDQIFWEGVQDYLKGHRELTVETDDFRKVMERRSGRSLQKFFDQWFHRAEYPSLKVEFSYDPIKKRGTFTTQQNQIDDKAPTLPFELLTEVQWGKDDKRETHEILITAKHHSFSFAMVDEPDYVRFDPNWRIAAKIEFNPGDARLKKQLVHAPDVPGRIHAAQELCKSGSGPGVAAVAEAMSREPFWGVRAEMARALEKAGTVAALHALSNALTNEDDPSVQIVIGAALARLRSPDSVIPLILNKLASGNLSAHAEAQLVQTLGAQLSSFIGSETPPDEEGRLAMPAGSASGLQASCWQQAFAPRLGKFDAPRGVVQGATLMALAQTRDPAQFSTILSGSRTKTGHWRIRHTAVHALGYFAQYDSDRQRRKIAEDALIDLLRDPEHQVKAAAAYNIYRAHLQNAAGQLRSYRQTLTRQEQPRIDSYLNALAHNDGDRVVSLTKDIDDLKDKLRKLEDQLQKIHDLEPATPAS